MTEKDNFEKRLLSELRQVSAENPAPAAQTEPVRTRRYGRFAAAGAGLAAVVAGVAIYTSTGDNTPSAYAVETDPDGKVSVEIINLTEATGLEESLRAVGVPAKVSSEPMATVCAVELEDGDAPKGDLKKTAPSATIEVEKGDGESIAAVPTTAAVPAVPAEPVEAGRTGVEAAAAPGKPALPDSIAVVKKPNADGASFSIDPETIAKGETVLIAPTQAKPAKAIPAGAPSAPPIAVSISEPGQGC